MPVDGSREMCRHIGRGVIGILLQNQQDYNEAVESFRKAIRFRPSLAHGSIIMAPEGAKNEKRQNRAYIDSLEVFSLQCHNMLRKSYGTKQSSNVTVSGIRMCAPPSPREGG
uniref:Uncharacterized protein n=1 Tax=Anopheles coluzzii TaxID=1518534 RepID=A0A8W7P871_ANOCL